MHGKVRDAIERTTDLTPEDAATLAVIALSVDSDGVAYPGRDKLGKVLKLSRSAVSARLRKLRQKGYITISHTKTRTWALAAQHHHSHDESRRQDARLRVAL